MLEASMKIMNYTDGYDFNDFSSDERTIDAFIRNFEVIGEAANRLNPEFKFQNPEIEWSRIRGFRNRIVHEYFGVDIQILWDIKESEIQNLIDWLKTIIEQNQDQQNQV